MLEVVAKARGPELDEYSVAAPLDCGALGAFTPDIGKTISEPSVIGASGSVVD
jgi:hypothetical protein